MKSGRWRFAELLPPTVVRRITDRRVFDDGVARYLAMSDHQLLDATRTCLRNLPRIDDTTGDADADLQLVLVPELWERRVPGTRDSLRRISSTLAEYDPDASSLFAQLLSSEAKARLRESGARLRQDIATTAILDTRALVERIRFAIAGSRTARRWVPEDCTYESGFTYRLVPTLARRVLERP